MAQQQCVHLDRVLELTSLGCTFPQLMQDSLGGNAKTLMFVNISPADYNSDESATSLTYASRVKLITNNANKNQDSEEVARLKGIIAKLKKGEAIDDEDDG